MPSWRRLRIIRSDLEANCTTITETSVRIALPTAMGTIVAVAVHPPEVPTDVGSTVETVPFRDGERAFDRHRQFTATGGSSRLVENERQPEETRLRL